TPPASSALSSLSLHDALPILAEFYDARGLSRPQTIKTPIYQIAQDLSGRIGIAQGLVRPPDYLDQLEDLALNHFPSRRAFCKARHRKSTRLNSSHRSISYAVF